MNVTEFSARVHLRRGIGVRRATVALVVTLVLLAAPFTLPSFWEQLLLFSGAAAIAAMGLQFLVGTSGQLSLAHGFFIAVGAYSYGFFGSKPEAQGLNLPTLLAAVLAVLVAGIFGILFSPIAGRLRGLHLGLASLALVMIAQHVLTNAEVITGGVYGRDVPALSVGAFEFADQSPYLAVLGHQMTAYDRLWYVVATVVILAYMFLRNIERSRVGRGLKAIRDSEPAAAAAGIHVQQYKAIAFALSSLYAGLGGVLLALLFQHVVPEYFSLTLSLDFLAVIVIGGVGSLSGALLGALLITGLPLVLSNYANYLPLVATPGGSGIQAGVLAQFVFGGLVVVILVVRWGRPAGGLTLRWRQRVSSPVYEQEGSRPTNERVNSA